MKQEILIAVISSSAIGAFISTILQPLIDLIKSKIEIKKINDERNYLNKKDRLIKKENTYISALELLMRIRSGFDVSDYDLLIDSKYFENDINELNQLTLELGPKIRIYSTGEIFEFYYSLSKWGKYAYSNIRLMEQSKEHFVLMYNYLAKLMQEDLGYSEGFQSEILQIECPKCGTIHDFDCPKCPDCGLKFDDLIKLLNCIEKNNLINDIEE